MKFDFVRGGQKIKLQLLWNFPFFRYFVYSVDISLLSLLLAIFHLLFQNNKASKSELLATIIIKHEISAGTVPL